MLWYVDVFDEVLGHFAYTMPFAKRQHQQGSIHIPSLTLLEVMLFSGLRTKGPAFCLAQPIGLGCSVQLVVRAEGPAVC